MIDCSILLKLKHLFYASYAGKISYLRLMETMGLPVCPESLDALKSTNLSSDKVGLIETLYEAQRHIDIKDPLPYFTMEIAQAVYGMKKFGQAGVSISNI